MKVREIILEKLENHFGEYVSGADLAHEAGVSRNAVWKAVNALVSGGVKIERTHHGYKLVEEGLSEYGIKRYLPPDDNVCVEVLEEVDSTNTYMKERAADGAEDFSLVASRSQSAGRGRKNASFYSPKNSGVYFTVLIRNIDFTRARFLTAMAAVASAEGIEQVFGLKARIKWVNDVYIDGKKCVGILTESVTNMELNEIDYAVVGIGINVREPEGGFPEEIKNIAGACITAAKGNAAEDAFNKVVAAVYTSLKKLYTNFDKARLNAEYVRRSYLDGKRVTVLTSGDEEYPATVKGIDEDFRLAVVTDAGVEKRLEFGEVKLRI